MIERCHLRVTIGGLAVAVVAGGLAAVLHEAEPVRDIAAVAESDATETTRIKPERAEHAKTSAPGTARHGGKPADPARAAVPLIPHGQISRVNLGSGARQGNDSLVGRPSVSANGRWVAFASLASNLVPGDRNDHADVFVRDRLTGTTTLVSATPAGRSGAGESTGPVLSADGRWVAFESWAPNLVAGPNRLTKGGSGVFLRNLHTARTTLLSVPSEGRANGDSAVPAIDATGTRVAFESRASNLVPGDGNGHSDVFVWTRAAGLERVSRDAAGADLPGGAAAPAISADGRRVAFVVAGTRGGDCEDVYARNLGGGALTLVSAGDGCGRFSDVAISGNGRHIAFSTSWPMTREDRDWAADVYVRDLAKRRTTLASVPATGVPALAERGASYGPSLDHEGRWIAFSSFATDLLPVDSTREQDAYVRDLRSGRTERLAVAPNGSSYGAVLTPDAAHVVFGAGAENLVATDNNHADDVFAVDRSGARYPRDGARLAPDHAAPDTLFVEGPSGLVRAGLLRFVLGSDEPGVRYQCRHDKGAWAKCLPEFSFRVGAGRHVVWARAIDPAGNVDRSPAAWVFVAR
ncbi:MAG: TolB family protein [Sporichthyaceae bacterium]